MAKKETKQAPLTDEQRLVKEGYTKNVYDAPRQVRQVSKEGSILVAHSTFEMVKRNEKTKIFGIKLGEKSPELLYEV